jgi:heme oxygenase (biliverdin-IX-beta and delta-forming)
LNKVIHHVILQKRLRVETGPAYDRTPPDERPNEAKSGRHLNVLDRLRAETAPAHDRIERTLDLTGRMGCRTGYRGVLERFHGFHAAWETVVEPVIADADFFEPRRKLGLLRRDLRVLGVDERALEALPRCAPLMPLRDAAAAFGAMYVVEGSTLGGAVISKHVARTLGLGPDTGCAYFHGYGATTGRMWNAFRRRLLSLSGPAADDMIVASARRTFAVLEGWLSKGQAA